MTSNLEKERDFALAYTKAWCGGNPEAVAGCYAPDGSLTINGGAPAVGRDAIAAAARGFMEAFPDLQVLFDGLGERDGRLEYRWTLVGTNTGPGGSGKRVKISGYELWRMGGDGLIADSLGYFDQDEYRRQVTCD